MYSDSFHICPTDNYVNGKRADYLFFGKITQIPWTSANDSLLGKNNNSRYSQGYTCILF